MTLDADDVEAIARRVAELLGGRLTPPAEPSPWMTVEEAAEYLRCRPKRVYDLVSQSRIPAHRDGSRRLFLRTELDEYLLAGDDGTPLAPVPDRPRLRGVSSGGRTLDPRVTRRAGRE